MKAKRENLGQRIMLRVYLKKSREKLREDNQALVVNVVCMVIVCESDRRAIGCACHPRDGVCGRYPD